MYWPNVWGLALIIFLNSQLFLLSGKYVTAVCGYTDSSGHYWIVYLIKYYKTLFNYLFNLVNLISIFFPQRAVNTQRLSHTAVPPCWPQHWSAEYSWDTPGTCAQHWSAECSWDTLGTRAQHWSAEYAWDTPGTCAQHFWSLLQSILCYNIWQDEYVQDRVFVSMQDGKSLFEETPTVPASGRLRQEDLKFEASLGYLLRPSQKVNMHVSVSIIYVTINDMHASTRADVQQLCTYSLPYTFCCSVSHTAKMCKSDRETHTRVSGLLIAVRFHLFNRHVC